jgi:hypothetical protein
MATLPDSAASRQLVDPRHAQGAQIPMQTFQLPQFPPEAGGLMALTLTSDIKLDEYSDLLSQPASVPPLPRSVQSLTLELFSLGYPPGFLGSLIDRLPDLKSLVLYSQLLSGITSESQDDAVRFFDKAKSLRALHLLDVFAKPTFFGAIAPKLRDREKGIMFLEINYTFRHEDQGFLARVPGDELPLLITPSLISCSLNISVPDRTDDPQDPTNLPTKDGKKNDADGVLAFDQSKSSALVQSLTATESAPRVMKLLNTTLYTISMSQLRSLLEKHSGLLVFSATVDLKPTEECKKELLDALAVCQSLEQVEIVASLGTQLQEGTHEERSARLANFFPTIADMEHLEGKCKKIANFKSNILRKTTWQSLEWTKMNDKWQGGVQQPSASVELGSDSKESNAAQQQVCTGAPKEP